MKRFIFALISIAAVASLTACTHYYHDNNHYCASNTWNGTKCVSSGHSTARVVSPVVVKQPAVVVR
ncbi:MAG: hypothetical protein HKM04_02515 [Legionellales bacterium]|nr:hypothetical protein [Legionellales bacterium]